MLKGEEGFITAILTQAVEDAKYVGDNKQDIKHKNARSIGKKLKTKSLMFFISFFFLWFVRIQILICEPQNIWHKLLVLS